MTTSRFDRPHPQRVPDPTPTQIEARAAEIRLLWTDEDRHRRMYCTVEHFKPRRKRSPALPSGAAADG